MKLALVIFLFVIILNNTQAQSECESPWQKVNEDICLFLNSVPKTWSHAKFLCNFYGGDLLYIENESEQNQIQNYLSKLIKYRFNKKSYVWLDLIDKFNENTWVWSRNNESTSFTNWMSNKNSFASNDNSNNMNCACLKLKDGLWKDCECSLSQHFVCRKSDRILNLDILMPLTTTSTTTTSTTTTTTSTTTTTTEDPEENAAMFNFDYDTTTTQVITENDENEEEDENEIETPIKQKTLMTFDELEDKRMIISTRVLLDEEDKLKEDILQKIDDRESSLESNILNNTNKEATKMLKMKSNNQMTKATRMSGTQTENAKSTATYSTNTLRIVIEKDISSFKTYFCPFGFGYYLNYLSGCSKYTKCEDWDSKYAVFSQYECSYNKIFSMSSFKCLPAFKSKCDSNSPIFIPF